MYNFDEKLITNNLIIFREEEIVIPGLMINKDGIFMFGNKISNKDIKNMKKFFGKNIKNMKNFFGKIMNRKFKISIYTLQDCNFIVKENNKKYDFQIKNNILYINDQNTCVNFGDKVINLTIKRNILYFENIKIFLDDY